MNYKLEKYFEGQKEKTKELLSKLVSFESTYGNERLIQDYIYESFIKRGLDISKMHISDEIKKSPDYTQTGENLSYEGRFNLFGKIKGSSEAKTMILNVHTDVVPASSNWGEAFLGTAEEYVVKGRGACDDKGGVAAIMIAVEALKQLGIKLKGNIEYQFVIEEEVGGNGTLAMIENGHTADCAIVMEPTDLYQCPAGRGAVWFEISINGKSVHMAEINEGISAIDNAIEVIEIIKRYEKEMVRKYGDHPLFRWHKRPSQINIGMIKAGEIPSMVPGYAVLEGGIGFLPNRRMEDVKHEFKEYIMKNTNIWLKDNIAISFNRLNNEAYEEVLELDCIRTMKECLIKNKLDGSARGFIASCDARLFHHLGKIPCIVFGPGSIKNAHSRYEKCSIEDIIKAARVLTEYMIRWCG